MKGNAYVIKELTEQEEKGGFFKNLGAKILKDSEEDPIDKSINLRL